MAEMITTAMLLAAGEGQRLRPLTTSTPKPMLEIAGRPILEHNVLLLAKHGFRDIVINVHHAPEKVTTHFGDGSRFGLRIRYSFESSLLGTAGAVKKVAEHFTRSFLVFYGDNLTTCNLSRLCAFHVEKAATATVALFLRQNATASGVAAVDAEDRIIRFVEKPSAEQVFSSWVNAGLLVLEPEVLNSIAAGTVSDFGRDILPGLLASGRPVYGYRMTEGLWWIDSPADYERTQRSALVGDIALT